MIRGWEQKIEEAQREKRWRVGGRLFDRIAYGDDGRANEDRCRDCAVRPGQLHVLGCCVERCPRCIEGQLFGCHCFTKPRH